MPRDNFQIEVQGLFHIQKLYTTTTSLSVRTVNDSIIINRIRKKNTFTFIMVSESLTKHAHAANQSTSQIHSHTKTQKRRFSEGRCAHGGGEGESTGEREREKRKKFNKRITIKICDSMTTTLVPLVVRRPSLRTTAGHTNYDHEFALDPISPGLRAAS